MATTKKKGPYTPVARTIFLAANGNAIDYGGNDPLTVYPTDTVSWQSNSHAIRIEFLKKMKFPFKKGSPRILTAPPGSPTPPQTARRPLISKLHFKYTATISDGMSILAEDPIIIIDNDGGGGGGGGDAMRSRRRTKKKAAARSKKK